MDVYLKSMGGYFGIDGRVFFEKDLLFTIECKMINISLVTQSALYNRSYIHSITAINCIITFT